MLPISAPHLRAMREAPPWRRIVIFLLFIVLSNILNAQIQKGQLHLGGQFSFNNYHRTGQNNFSATVQPDVGLMLSSKWSLGLGLPYSYISSGSGQSRSMVGLVPFVRRYFDLKAGFYAIAHAQAGVQFDLSSDRSIWEAQITPAITYLLNPSFVLEAGFGGLSYTRNNDSFNGQETFNSNRVIEFRTTPIFSLRYYFPTN